MQELDSIIKFIKLTNEFREIERVILIKDKDQWENDVEHSYQLAMSAWYVISVFKLPLNVDKALKYALLHDLVEIYAGDTYIYDPDPNQHASKKDREKQALEQLKQEFTEFPEMTEWIAEYESKNDEESKFVYALDKLISVVNIYLDNGRLWHKKDVALQQLLDYKLGKVAVDPDIKKYFDQLVVLLKNEPNLFPRIK